MLLDDYYLCYNDWHKYNNKFGVNMVELQTLKDILPYQWNEKDKFLDVVDIVELRQEAIKWIKYNEDKIKEIEDDTKRDSIANCSRCGHNIYTIGKRDVTDFIKHFFNINEEELK